jgi:hypothetical protein
MDFQVWLPFPDEIESLRCLNQVHLNSLRYNILELMETYHLVSQSDSKLPSNYERHPLIEADHPILDQFVGFELWLAEYGLKACEEWQFRRGKHDPLYDHISMHLELAAGEDADMGKPNWFGEIDFHLSHQAALLREDESHYKGYFLVDRKKNLIIPRSTYAPTT